MTTEVQVVPRRAARAASSWLGYGFGLVFLLLVLVPIGYMVLVSLQPSDVAGTTLSVQGLSPRAFVDIWSVIDLAGNLENSIVVATCTAVLSSIVGFGAAYVLSRFRFRGRDALRLSLLACYSTPGIVLVIPLYAIYVQIQNALGVKLIGSPPVLILTYMSFSLPYTIWMLTGYLVSIPEELEEAAALDGATRLQTLRKVVFPLARPAMVVTAIFAFVLAWNDVLFASVLTSDTTRTVGVGIQAFVSASADGGLPQWNNLMAAGLVTSLPPVLVFVFVQRYLISGLTAGSVKG
ncbi:carbohydrate ABC transporter permease [Amycolatopsis acidiphila]|uniref:Carbohydrate ABC transporter permease n=1 Tax=Amycolatopsis acidiphila TaxID=715473 RepID=A0A558AM52_9PSEU|nr:carbohydrate ABC transporter permease [Amycolatopsis acidiphila]TVT25345.1 carbohydrate ABC transporter permease [Amycolatopsis acidiphila]UIJ62475.1 carbohydrate ABC transporter permease [Amycolatopsis acidiphila]GHG83857.1 ABC transporter permease [Amycolatopsis acidiphila]